ncbi:MAG: tetratricopeptide repeat protein [Nitrospirota bacterium]
MASIAKELLNAGEYSEAYDLYFWLPEETHAKARFQGMADCLIRLEQFDDAIIVAENAIKIYPSDIDLRVTYLNALNLTDEYEKCLNAAYDSLLAFPDVAVFVFFIAQSHEFLEQWDEAEERYRTLLNENPEDAVLHEHVARCLVGKGQSVKAIPILKRAIRVSPEYSGCYYELVQAYTELDQFDKALWVAKKTFKLFSANEGLAYTFLGMALHNCDDHDKAIDILQEGLLLYPDQDEIAELMDDIEGDE